MGFTVRFMLSRRIANNYTYWDFLTEKARNTFSFTSWSKKLKANQMSRITFFTCEESHASNQVPRMFFDAWAVTRWFSFRLSLFNYLASVEVISFLLSLKTWARKDLLPRILRLRIRWKISKAKTQKRRRSEMWNCSKNFEKRKERRARSARHKASRIKQVSYGV